MVRRLIGLLALVTAATAMAPAASAYAACAAPPKPPPQRFGVRLVDVPVSEAHNPRGLRYIIDFLPTGTTVHRRILVLNEEARTARFTVYPDAAAIGHGVFTGDAGHTRSELTTWITVKHPSLILRPHTSTMDMVTIRVPGGATRGEHYGVIWVQQVAHAHLAGGFVINQIARVGIRVYLAVGHGGAPPTKFVIAPITGHRTASGQPYIVAHVRDTGGRAVDLAGTAWLTRGPGDTSAGPFRSQQIITLAPGQSGNMTFAAGRHLPAGPWLARVTLVSGLTRVTATATIRFLASVAAPGWSGMAFTALLGGLFLGVLVLAAVLARRVSHARRLRV